MYSHCHIFKKYAFILKYFPLFFLVCNFFISVFQFIFPQGLFFQLCFKCWLSCLYFFGPENIFLFLVVLGHFLCHHQIFKTFCHPNQSVCAYSIRDSSGVYHAVAVVVSFVISAGQCFLATFEDSGSFFPEFALNCVRCFLSMWTVFLAGSCACSKSLGLWTLL